MKRLDKKTSPQSGEIVYDIRRAKQAVQFLVECSYCYHHIKKLRNTVEKPRSMPFKDDTEVLNELLVIGRQNMQAMENLIAIAEMKRGGKNDYQREYMATKRKRDKKVLQLEELMVGKPLTPTEKSMALQYQHAVWTKERGEFLKKQPDMTWLARNEVVREFWDRKEQELDKLILMAQERTPPKRKRHVIVEYIPKSGFGQALSGAIKKPKPVDKKR